MRVHQRAVDVDQQQPVGVRAGLPGPPAGLGPGRPQPGQAELVTGDALNDPPGGGGRGDRAEQPTLVTQHRQVAQAVPTVGQDHRQVPQHPTGVVAVPRRLAAAGPPPKRGGQPEPVGQLGQQRRADVPDHALAVAGDFEAGTRVGSLHPQGALLERWMRPEQPHSPSSGGHLRPQPQRDQAQREKPRLR
jgi:hypothetical protein